MSRRRLAVLLALLVLPLALVLSFRPLEGEHETWVPVGYLREVDRLIDEGKLAYVCASERIEPRGLTDREEFFLRNSYLEDDLAQWNAGDRRPFLVEHRDLAGGGCDGEVVRISETFHVQRLPAYAASSWRGRLFFHQGPPALALVAPDGGRLEVVRPAWPRLPLRATSYTDVWVGPNRKDARVERMALKWREAGRMFASVEHVGDQAAIEVYQDRPRTTLNGCAVPTGARVRLDGNDRVWLQETTRLQEQYRVESGIEAGLLSYVTLVNGERRRRTFANRLPMAEPLVRAIDTAVAEADEARRQAAAEGRAQGAGGRDDFDVHLTLDDFLQDLLTRELGRYCQARYPGRPLRAAVTLLEPQSGRVLALASYPTVREESGSPRRRGAAAVVLGQNHNFLAHPIGSATKPFLAAAALATQPGLAQLTTPCHPGGPPPPRLLGYDFGSYALAPDCRGDGEVGFRRFLEVSSNRYMLALGMLALAEWRGGAPVPDTTAPPLVAPDGYRLAGAAAARRPRLAVVKDETHAGATELAGLQDMPFYHRFRDIFGYSVHYEAGPADQALAMEGWQPATQAAGGSGREVALAFSPVTPERVNLRANLIQQARQDLYTNLLGLGNNRWSNLQLAESLARLLTGKAVDYHLIERVVVPADPPRRPQEEVLWDLDAALRKTPPATLPLAEESRQLVLDGMRLVVEGQHGTGAAVRQGLARLNSRVPAQVQFAALAKTGTPSTELKAVRRGPTEPAPTAIRVDQRGLTWVDHAVLVLALTRHDGAASEQLVLTFFIEGQGGAGEATALAAALLEPLARGYWPEDWMVEE